MPQQPYPVLVKGQSLTTRHRNDHAAGSESALQQSSPNTPILFSASRSLSTDPSKRVSSFHSGLSDPSALPPQKRAPGPAPSTDTAGPEPTLEISFGGSQSSDDASEPEFQLSVTINDSVGFTDTSPDVLDPALSTTNSSNDSSIGNLLADAVKGNLDQYLGSEPAFKVEIHLPTATTTTADAASDSEATPEQTGTDSSDKTSESGANGNTAPLDAILPGSDPIENSASAADDVQAEGGSGAVGPQIGPGETGSFGLNPASPTDDSAQPGPSSVGLASGDPSPNNVIAKPVDLSGASSNDETGSGSLDQITPSSVALTQAEQSTESDVAKPVDLPSLDLSDPAQQGTSDLAGSVDLPSPDSSDPVEPSSSSDLAEPVDLTSPGASDPADQSPKGDLAESVNLPSTDSLDLNDPSLSNDLAGPVELPFDSLDQPQQPSENELAGPIDLPNPDSTDPANQSATNDFRRPIDLPSASPDQAGQPSENDPAQPVDLASDSPDQVDELPENDIANPIDLPSEAADRLEQTPNTDLAKPVDLPDSEAPSQAEQIPPDGSDQIDPSSVGLPSDQSPDGTAQEPSILPEPETPADGSDQNVVANGSGDNQDQEAAPAFNPDQQPGEAGPEDAPETGQQPEGGEAIGDTPIDDQQGPARPAPDSQEVAQEPATDDLNAPPSDATEFVDGASATPDSEIPAEDAPESQEPTDVTGNEATESGVVDQGSEGDNSASDSGPTDSKPTDSGPIDSEPTDGEAVDGEPTDSGANGATNGQGGDRGEPSSADDSIGAADTTSQTGDETTTSSMAESGQPSAGPAGIASAFSNPATKSKSIGILVGGAVGVFLLVALAGFLWWFIRRRKKQQEDEDSAQDDNEKGVLNIGQPRLQERQDVIENYDPSAEIMGNAAGPDFGLPQAAQLDTALVDRASRMSTTRKSFLDIYGGANTPYPQNVVDGYGRPLTQQFLMPEADEFQDATGMAAEGAGSRGRALSSLSNIPPDIDPDQPAPFASNLHPPGTSPVDPFSDENAEPSGLVGGAANIAGCNRGDTMQMTNSAGSHYEGRTERKANYTSVYMANPFSDESQPGPAGTRNLDTESVTLMFAPNPSAPGLSERPLSGPGETVYNGVLEDYPADQVDQRGQNLGPTTDAAGAGGNVRDEGTVRSVQSWLSGIYKAG